MKPTSAVWIASARSVACTCGATKRRVDSLSTRPTIHRPPANDELPAERAADGAAREVLGHDVQEVRRRTRENRPHERTARVRTPAGHACGGVGRPQRDDDLPSEDE